MRTFWKPLKINIGSFRRQKSRYKIQQSKQNQDLIFLEGVSVFIDKEEIQTSM